MRDINAIKAEWERVHGLVDAVYRGDLKLTPEEATALGGALGALSWALHLPGILPPSKALKPEAKP